MKCSRSFLFAFIFFLFSLPGHASLSEDLRSRKIIHLKQSRGAHLSTSTRPEVALKSYVLVYRDGLDPTQIENLLRRMTQLKLTPQRVFTELREIHFESPKSERELKDSIHDSDIVELHSQTSFSIDE